MHVCSDYECHDEKQLQAEMWRIVRSILTLGNEKTKMCRALGILFFSVGS